MLNTIKNIKRVGVLQMVTFYSVTCNLKCKDLTDQNVKINEKITVSFLSIVKFNGPFVLKTLNLSGNYILT